MMSVTMVVAQHRRAGPLGGDTGGGGKPGSICHSAVPLVLQCLGVPLLGETARKASSSHPPFLCAPKC